jgi:hypothetical protein
VSGNEAPEDKINRHRSERRDQDLQELVPVYFMERGDGNTRIGKGGDRPTMWLQNGYSLLAIMPGGEPLEKALHRYFRPHRLDFGTSHYPTKIVLPYLEALLKKGYATDREEDVGHVPHVPIDVVMPDAVMSTVEAPQVTGDQLQFPECARPAMPSTPRQRIAEAAAYYLHSSKSDEWYTPLNIIEASRRVLGAIDLDPASCWKANRRIRATNYYSENVSGLSRAHPWRGRVWMNPPYGDQGPLFAARLVDEFVAGNVTAACAMYSLTHVSALWFQPVARVCCALAVTKSRVQFDVGRENQIKTGTAPVSGHVIVYFGQRLDRFYSEFNELCTVYPGPSSIESLISRTTEAAE